MRYGRLCWFVLCCLVFNSLANYEVSIDTSLGKVVGFRNGSLNVFLGIPFAEPPIGRLRFRPTVPKVPWHPNIHYALKFSPECMQSNLFSNGDDGIGNDEDCLYINIWQPIKAKKNPAKLFPVIVWFYGGAFMHGGSARREYYGNYLSSQGALVVTFNYRVGALGFLVSTSDGLFGNYGLMDQYTALVWIKQNIIHFDGDPNRITLFGESAGAMSIGLHFFQSQSNIPRWNDGDNNEMKTAKKRFGSECLFHAIILQSNPFGYK
jgi:para-nitrobenzyl esterase